MNDRERWPQRYGESVFQWSDRLKRNRRRADADAAIKQIVEKLVPETTMTLRCDLEADLQQLWSSASQLKIEEEEI